MFNIKWIILWVVLLSGLLSGPVSNPSPGSDPQATSAIDTTSDWCCVAGASCCKEGSPQP